MVTTIEPRSSHASAFTRRGSTEITLCAEVADLTNISQSIPAWTSEVNIVRGISPESFITYVSKRFPEVKEVRDLVASNEINYKLLEAVSDRIELGAADVVSMFLRSQAATRLIPWYGISCTVKKDIVPGSSQQPKCGSFIEYSTGLT